MKRKDISPLLTRPILTHRSSSSARAPKRIPISFNVTRMIRFDALPSNLPTNVDQILKKPSLYSTPDGVKQFIYDHTIEQTLNHSAIIIQRTWRRYKVLKKLFRYLSFAHNLAHQEHLLVFYTWYVYLTPPANLAKRIYTNLRNYYAYHPQKLSSDMRIATFEEFIKTNYLLIRKDINMTKILQFVKLISRLSLRKIFPLWSEYAIDRMTIQKCDPRARVLFNGRDQFGNEFIYFHFWRKWASYKKKKRFDVLIENHVYLFEWSFYRATVETKHRLKEKADNNRRHVLLRNSINAIRENSLYEVKLEQKYRNCIQIFMRSSMKKAVRALSNHAILQKFNQGIRKRLIRAWYEAIDKSIIETNSIGAFNRRKELKILNRIFIGWHGYAQNEMVRQLKLMVDSRKYESTFSLVIYALQGDDDHFWLVSFFTKWRRLISMKKFANRFVYWSFHLAQKREFNTFLMALFKENIGRAISHIDYLPFVDKDKSIIHHINLGKTAKNAHFWKQIQELVANKESIPFSSPVCSQSNTLYGILNCKNCPLNGTWDQTASSEEVKTLFYRIILLMIQKSKIIKLNSRKIDRTLLLKKFKDENNLYDHSTICSFRDQLELESSERRILHNYRMHHDYDQLVSLEAHDAAQSYQENSVNFSLKSEPHTTFTIETPSKSNDTLIVRTSVHEEGKLNEDLVQSHPFLQPIEVIKNQIIQNNRKFLRKPEEVFKNQRTILPAILTEQIPGQRKGGHKHENYSAGYENYVPIVENREISDLFLVDRTFRLQELKNLQNEAKSEERKRQLTEDLHIITTKSKPKPRHRTISAKQSKEIQEEEQAVNQSIANIDSNFITSKQVDNLEKGIMFSKICPIFIDNQNHFQYDQKKRIELIMKKFFNFLNFLLFGSSSAFEIADFDMLHQRLIKIIGRVKNECQTSSQKKKGKGKGGKGKKTKLQVNRPSSAKSQLSNRTKEKSSETDIKLDDQPPKEKKNAKKGRPKTSLKKTRDKKSIKTISPRDINKQRAASTSPPASPSLTKAPSDPNYFSLTRPKVHEKWMIAFFGKAILNNSIEVMPFPHFIGADILFKHLRVFLFIEGNVEEVVSHLKRVIETVPECSNQTSQILNDYIKLTNYQEPVKKEELPNPIDTVMQNISKSKGTSRKSFMPPDPASENKTSGKKEKVQFQATPRARKKKVKIAEIPLPQRKFTFATDIVGAITSISEFLSPYVQIISPEPEKTVDAFSGLDELRSLIQQKVNSSEINIIVPEEYEEFGLNRPESPKAAATTETLEKLTSSPPKETIKSRRRTIAVKFSALMTEMSNQAKVERQNWMNTLNEIKTVTENDIDLFLSICPYAIPFKLLTLLINSEMKKAQELIQNKKMQTA